jgi:hypothetical protein
MDWREVGRSPRPNNVTESFESLCPGVPASIMAMSTVADGYTGNARKTICRAAGRAAAGEVGRDC